MQKAFVFATVAYTLGIAAGLYPGEFLPLIAAVVGLTAASLLAGKNGLATSFLIAAMFVCGFGYSHFVDSHNRSVFPESWEGRQIKLSGIAASRPQTDGDLATFKMRTEENENVLIRLKLQRAEEADFISRLSAGDTVTVAGELERPRVPGNFGDFDYRRYLHDRHIHWILKVKGIQSLRVGSEHGLNRFLPLRWVESWRKALSRDVEKAFSPDHRALMNSLLLGITDDFDPALFDQFSRLGITHILAISGLHVAVVIGGLIVLCVRLGLPKERVLLAAMLAVPFYVAVTGASPSACRAGLMAFFGLYAARKGRMKDTLVLVCAAGAVLLTWNPYYIADIGFQLSFFVTIGLIIGVPNLNKLLPVRNRSAKNFLSVTLTAQWASFPLTIYYFNGFSLLSPLANMLIVPMYSFAVLPLGYIAMLAAALAQPAGKWLAYPVEWLLSSSYRLVDLLDHWQAFYLLWQSPAIWWMLAYYAVSVIFLHAAAATRQEFDMAIAGFRRLRAFARNSLPFAMAALLICAYFPQAFSGHKSSVAFLDVGQGDACLLRTAAGHNILIDGGGTLDFSREEAWRKRNDPFDIGKDVLVPLLKRRGVRHLDALIVSHEDADHIEGLLAVLDRIDVKRLLFNGTLKDSPDARELFAKALAKHVPLFAVADDMTLQVDNDLAITFLHPASAPLSKSGMDGKNAVQFEDNQNDASVVMLVRLEQALFLFTGDIDAATEQEIMLRHPTLRHLAPDVLKVAHHGSNKSSSAEWLDFWQPRAAVISVGANNVYGHPGQATLQRLLKRRIPVLRTDQNGEVQFVVDGELLRMRTKKTGTD
ncbi:MAG TPA: DNA internalization-related competence protein ComEC/Rec2 [Bacilli bacterium]